MATATPGGSGFTLTGRRFLSWMMVLVLTGLLGGCASIPFDAPKTSSYALEDTADTHLGRVATRAAGERPGQSGFYLLRDGIEALAARLILSEQAERSIDAQYYLLHDDVTGRLFVRQLLRAADRGVRVRLLLDDIDTRGYDAGMAVLDSHPNIEIRLFNPFPRGFGKWVRTANEFHRINRRMHNKSMTFDNAVTIVGGRNIGAEYFEAREDSNYSDLDLLGVGPVARDVSAAFDEYWNSSVAVPAQVLLATDGAGKDLEALRDDIDEAVTEAAQTPYGRALTSTIMDSIAKEPGFLTSAVASVVADQPRKAEQDQVEGDPQRLGSIMAPKVREAQRELVLVSPYFVPGENGVELIRELTDAGVRVLILTNSLAANDVTMVHSGYARYRKDLLDAGVELWEARPDPARPDRQRRGLGYSLSSLHAKAFAVDRRHLFIGSFNWDPRSLNINTEMGIYIDAPTMAMQAVERFERDLDELAYRLRLDQGGELEWVSLEAGREVIHTSEPEASFWQRFWAGFYRLLPIEGQL